MVDEALRTDEDADELEDVCLAVVAMTQSNHTDSSKMVCCFHQNHRTHTNHTSDMQRQQSKAKQSKSTK